MSTAARAVEPQLHAGDRILVIEDDFPSVVLPWRRTAQQTGAIIVTVATPADGNWTRAILENIGTDHLDFYHAWTVNNRKMYEACVRKNGWLEGVRKAMDEGVVKHVGITTHATPEYILRILDDDLFEVVTVQYSLILQGYRHVIARAHEKGLGVVLMGPLAGGLLAAPSLRRGAGATPLTRPGSR